MQRVPVEQSDYFPSHRAERVITAGRVALALFLVLAVSLNSNELAPYTNLIWRGSLTYLTYATAVAGLVWTVHTLPRLLPIVTHLIDLVLFAAIMHLSAAPTSPFFVYLIFAIVCGLLRWHGRGALLTGAAALFGYIALSIAGKFFVAVPDEFERTRFITRCTQLAVITGLLAYFGAYQRLLQREIAQLAAWPRRLPADEGAAVRDVLTQAATILRVSRIVVAWHDGEEPFLRIAVLENERFALTRQPPDEFGAVVAEALEFSSFFCDNVIARPAFVIFRVPGGFDSYRGQPLDSMFAERYGVTSVVALKLATHTVNGHLFALDRRPLAIDDILLGDIVGRLVASALEQQALIMQLRDAAVTEERLRLARELHDGVLQSLTAVGLQANRLRGLVANSPEAAQRVSVLEETIAGEHRALRQMLDDLQPGRGGGGQRVPAANRLREVITRLERQWDVSVRCESSRDMPPLNARLVHEICRMTEEAVVNAIRHGGAREVAVNFELADGDRLRLAVSYRGEGFATFRGRRDLASLEQLQQGPRSLKERVAALGGDLVIDSDESGATVEIIVRAGERP